MAIGPISIPNESVALSTTVLVSPIFHGFSSAQFPCMVSRRRYVLGGHRAFWSGVERIW
jgi:hypothetical protein